MRYHWPIIIALATAVSGCSFFNDAFGTGGTPYTREIVVMVLRNVPDTLDQVPMAGAVISVKQITSNKPRVGSVGGTGQGTTDVPTQTQGTDPSGKALFRVEPGESYSVTISASGYTGATLVVSPSYYGPQQIVRTVTLAASA